MLNQLNEQHVIETETTDKAVEKETAALGTESAGRKERRNFKDRKKPMGLKKPTAAKSEFEEKLVT